VHLPIGAGVGGRHGGLSRLDSLVKGKFPNFFLPLLLLFPQDLLQLQASPRLWGSMNDDNAPSAALFPVSSPSCDVKLPGIAGSLSYSSASGQTLRVDGTNVVRVPFGVRQPRRARPARPERWATVVLPFQLGGSTPPPPQAA
jgi:hypothetical protein